MGVAGPERESQGIKAEKEWENSSCKNTVKMTKDFSFDDSKVESNPVVVPSASRNLGVA